MKRSFLLSLALFLVLTGISYTSTWSFTQGHRNLNCLTSSTSCTVTLPSGVAGGPGDVVVVVAGTTSATSTTTISSATLGTGNFTLVPGTACASQASGGIDVDCAYLIDPPAGQTSVVVNISQSPNGAWYAMAVELKAAGPAFFDVAGATATTGGISATGPTLPLRGTNEAIIQSIRGGKPTSITEGYTSVLGSWGGGVNSAYLINTGTGTGPTWTQGGSQKAALNGIAFSSVANSYCGPGDAAQFGSTDGPATLPTACIYTGIDGSPSNGTLHNIASTSDLTNCLAGNSSCPTSGGQTAAPVCGDVFSLQSGNTFTGNFTLGSWAVCDSQHWLTIETSSVALIPAPENRINPSYIGIASLPGRPSYSGPNANYLAKLTNSNTSPVLTFSQDNAYIRVIGIEFTQGCNSGEVGDVVTFNNNAGINHIIFDRIVGHGCADSGTSYETEKFLAFNRGSYIALIDSYMYDFFCVSGTGSCTQAHVVGGGTNANSGDTDKAWKVVDNFLEGAGEAVFTGGATAAITPTDYEIRENHFFKPQTWNPSDPSYNHGVAVNGKAASAIAVENHMEFKNVDRVLAEGNYMENVWGGFSQNGAAFLINPKNQSPGNECTSAPVGCSVQNVTVRYGWVKTANKLAQVDNLTSDSGYFAGYGSNHSVHDIVAENLAPANCNMANNPVESGVSLYTGVNMASGSGSITVNGMTVTGTVSFASTPVWIAIGSILTVSGASIPDYDCTSCTVTGVTPTQVSYTLPSGSARNDTSVTASVVPPNSIIHDVTFNHLTLVYAATSCAGTWPADMLGFDGPLGSLQYNLNWTNIIDSAGHYAVGGILSGVSRCGYGQSTTDMTTWFDACYSTSSFTNNCIVGGSSNVNWHWPSGSLFPTGYTTGTNPIDFVNYNSGVGGNYHLQSSSICHNAGTDGLDDGANVTTVINLTNPAQ